MLNLTSYWLLTAHTAGVLVCLVYDFLHNFGKIYVYCCLETNASDEWTVDRENCCCMGWFSQYLDDNNWICQSWWNLRWWISGYQINIWLARNYNSKMGGFAKVFFHYCNFSQWSKYVVNSKNNKQRVLQYFCHRVACWSQQQNLGTIGRFPCLW